MDESLSVRLNPPSRSDVVKSLADYLLQYPQDIIDATRLIKNFQVSVHEFNQALLVIDNKSTTKPVFI